MMTIIPIFWRWYYGEAIRNILKGWKNFIIFASEYFSIPLLFKTLFAPWKRDITKKPRGLDFKKLFEYISFNLISRTIGFSIRIITIFVGILFFLLIVVLGLLFFLIWLLLPLILIGLFILALGLII